MSKIPESYYPLLEKIESNGRLYAKASTSTGSGLYQFLRATWVNHGGTWGKDMTQPFGGLKPTREEQLARVRDLTEQNAKVLERGGLELNRATLYAAHFLGAGMAVKLLMADVKESAEKIAGPAATKANPTILKGKTVGQFMTWLKKKTDDWAR